MLLVLRGQAAERPAVTLRDAPIGDRGLHDRGQIEQAQRVGDRRARTSDTFRDGLVRQTEVVDQPTEAVRGLDRVEILTLQVLDQGQFESLTVVEVADDGRDPLETRRHGGADATLPRDQLVTVKRLGHEHRLEHTVFADARGQRRHLSIAEPAARLVRVRTDAGDRDIGRRRPCLASLWDQCGKPAAKALGAFRSNGHDSTTSRSG